MKRIALIVGVLVLLAADSATASGRGRLMHRRHHRVACPAQAVSYQQPASIPATAAYQTPVAAPPMTYAAQQPAPAGQPAAPPSPTGVQPLYNYAANPGQQAYYYTYDDSGKLVVSQWVDWLFRGGRAEGMPRPPLPVIGALGNRNR